MSGGMDAAWAAVEAALPKAGWLSDDGRWVIPSGVWEIAVRRYPEDGDGHFEPYYPEHFEATVEISPGKRLQEHADTPTAALLALAEKLRAER